MIRFEKTEHAPKEYHISDIVGALVLCWDANDMRPAIEQHDERQMGNGAWNDFKGFKFDPDKHTLKYSGDPTLKPWAFARLPLTNESIYVYESAWVALVNDQDGTFTVDRRD